MASSPNGINLKKNRKRGDDLAAVEYLQKEDPEIQKKIAKSMLENALNKL
jgi:hypothetical protein